MKTLSCALIVIALLAYDTAATFQAGINRYNGHEFIGVMFMISFGLFVLCLMVAER